MTRFEHAGELPVSVAAPVIGFDPGEYLSPVERRRTSRHLQFAVCSIREALLQAAIDLDSVDRSRIGICMGNTIADIPAMVKQVKVFDSVGWRHGDPAFLTKSFPYMGTMWLATKFGVRGPTNTCVTACSAGTEAIGMAYNWIRQGVADIVIAGGTEAWLNSYSLAGFGLYRVFTPSKDPINSNRPFDASRSGCVPGEGAGFLVVEELGHAVSRGSTPLAEILGFATTHDAHSPLAPDPEGRRAAECMTLAIEKAGIVAQQVDHVNAHGTATRLNDRAESAALETVFRDQVTKLPVAAIKSMTGHCLAASGAIETIAAIKSLETGVVPPVVNFREADPDCRLDIVFPKARTARVDVVLKSSFALGGQNASLVLGKSRS